MKGNDRLRCFSLRGLPHHTADREWWNPGLPKPFAKGNAKPMTSPISSPIALGQEKRTHDDWPQVLAAQDAQDRI